MTATPRRTDQFGAVGMVGETEADVVFGGEEGEAEAGRSPVWARAWAAWAWA